MSKKSFISGAVTLGIAGIFVKILGFLFRIPLGRMIGAGGMGDYAPAYDIYTTVLVFATAGIPVAISKMVAERCAIGQYKNAGKVFDLSRKIMWVLGIAGFIILYFGAGIFASLVHMESSELAIKAISPTLLFAPIMSSYRGYFQGWQKMEPTAISQMTEQLFRVIIGLSAAYIMYNTHYLYGNEQYSVSTDVAQSRGAAGACFGAVGGAMFGLIVIVLIFRFNKNEMKQKILGDTSNYMEPGKDIVKQIALISAPIILAACVMPLVNLADVAIVMRRLTENGIEYATAKSMFGELTSFAAPIIGMPQIIIQAIAVGLVPLVSASMKLSKTDRLHSEIRMGYRAAIIIMLPCSAGIFALAKPIMLLFYGDQVDNAIPCLEVYAVAFVFLSMTIITTAILQGIGKQNIPVINLIIGLSIKILATWILAGVSAINVKGAAIGTVVAYITTTVLDIRFLKKTLSFKLLLNRMIFKTTAASLIMGVVVFGVYLILEKITGSLAISLLVSIMVGVVIYGFELVIWKILKEEDLEIIPMGDKLKGLFKYIKR
ncbi:MAG: polysaccharide biosynthesis protein [Firmicutes bacterium]|nr:polysaccharide biosynthesis protein [Bacillota bacterium]MDY6173633.1 polysaccharide biosynthesis protein [Lentihominibacter sp.]